MRSLRIGIDVDEVVASLHQPWIEAYNRTYNDRMTVEDITDWDIQHLVKPECGSKIFDLLGPHMYEQDLVQPIPGANLTIKALRRLGHRISYVTSCTAGTMQAKIGWLFRHGFLVADTDVFLPGKDKSNAPVDVLIDDGWHNVQSFNGPAILVNRPHNRSALYLARISHLVDFISKGYLELLSR
jgi:5'-nucleotidase